MPAEEKPIGRKNKKERFFDALPLSFNRQKYLEVAGRTGINPRTVERYITQFVRSGLLHRDQMDLYLKLVTEDPGNDEKENATAETTDVGEAEEENH